MTPEVAHQSVNVLRTAVRLKGIVSPDVTAEQIAAVRSANRRKKSAGKPSQQDTRARRLYKFMNWLKLKDTHERLCRETEQLLIGLANKVVIPSHGTTLTPTFQAVEMLILLAAKYGEEMFKLKNVKVYYDLGRGWEEIAAEQQLLTRRVTEEN